MKTCSNPKCKATGIPDEAKFCPKCGSKLLTAKGPWKKKIEALAKEEEDLCKQRKILSDFQQHRQKMYNTLKKDDVFLPSMQESADAMRRNHQKDVEYDTESYVWLWGESILICSVPVGVFYHVIHDFDSITFDAFNITLLIVLFIWLIVGVGITLYRLNARKQREPYWNRYIDKYIKPFVEAQEESYSILGIEKPLEWEIKEQKEISERIKNRIMIIDERSKEIQDERDKIASMN